MKMSIVASSLALGASIASADLAYASDTAGGFWLLDLENLTSEQLFTTTPRFQSIAASNTGAVYGSTGTEIYRIDLALGTTTLVGSILDDTNTTRQTNAMAFVGDRLIGVEFNNFQDNGGSRVYEISLSDGSATDILTSNTFVGIARGASAGLGNDILIRDNFLASIDLDTSEAVRVGQTSNTNFAVELINGTYYGATNSGVVNIIDEEGRLNFLHDFGSQAFRGLTIVPTPGALSLMGVAGLAMGTRRRGR